MGFSTTADPLDEPLANKRVLLEEPLHRERRMRTLERISGKQVTQISDRNSSIRTNINLDNKNLSTTRRKTWSLLLTLACLFDTDSTGREMPLSLRLPISVSPANSKNSYLKKRDKNARKKKKKNPETKTSTLVTAAQHHPEHAIQQLVLEP